MPQAANGAWHAFGAHVRGKVACVTGREQDTVDPASLASDAFQAFTRSREEVVSAMLIGLPAAGLGVTQVLPAAIAAFDAA